MLLRKTAQRISRLPNVPKNLIRNNLLGRYVSFLPSSPDMIGCDRQSPRHHYVVSITTCLDCARTVRHRDRRPKDDEVARNTRGWLSSLMNPRAFACRYRATTVGSERGMRRICRATHGPRERSERKRRWTHIRQPQYRGRIRP